MSHHASLRSYQKMIYSQKKILSCCKCKKPFLPRELERHLFADHSTVIPNIHSCPWCSGAFSWLPRQKARHARHLSDCFKQYRKDFQWKPVTPPSPKPSTSPVAEADSRAYTVPLYQPQPLCEPRAFYGRVKLKHLHPLAYEDAFLPPALSDDDDSLAWWRLPSDGNRLPFVECNDLAIRYIRKFIHFADSTVGWFHVIVRAYALDAFFHRFADYVDPEDEAKRHAAFLLDYSCWCDGGKRYQKRIHQHHRHMIVVARNGNHFMQHCWKKVHAPKPPYKNYRYKLCFKMKTWKHLQNTLFYVSSRKSTCKLTGFHQTEIREPGNKMNHFYIYKPVTPQFKLCVALALEGGIQEWITSIQGQKKVTPFAPFCVRKKRKGYPLYAVRIKDVTHLERDWMYSVIPVRKEWVPTGVIDRNKSSAYFNLMEGFRMHFGVREDVEMEDGEWAKMQAGMGNVFLESVKNDWWYPPRNQQRLLNEVVPLVQKVRLQERTIQQQKRENKYYRVRQKRDWENRRRQKADFRNQMTRLKLENKLEKQKVEFRNQMTRLKMENKLERQKADFENQMTKLKIENEEFQRQINLKEENIKRLKVEKEDAKREMRTLQMELVKTVPPISIHNNNNINNK